MKNIKNKSEKLNNWNYLGIFFFQFLRSWLRFDYVFLTIFLYNFELYDKTLCLILFCNFFCYDSVLFSSSGWLKKIDVYDHFIKKSSPLSSKWPTRIWSKNSPTGNVSSMRSIKSSPASPWTLSVTRRKIWCPGDCTSTTRSKKHSISNCDVVFWLWRKVYRKCRWTWSTGITNCNFAPPSMRFGRTSPWNCRSCSVCRRRWSRSAKSVKKRIFSGRLLSTAIWKWPWLRKIWRVWLCSWNEFWKRVRYGTVWFGMFLAHFLFSPSNEIITHSNDWSIDWLIDRSTDRLIDWLIDWLIARLIDWLVNSSIRSRYLEFDWFEKLRFNFAAIRCIGFGGHSSISRSTRGGHSGLGTGIEGTETAFAINRPNPAVRKENYNKKTEAKKII